MYKLGLIINPLAGLGGSTALKGSDGADIVSTALARGAKPKAEDRASQTLMSFKALVPGVENNCRILTCSGSMGERVAKQAGFSTEVVYLCGKNLRGENERDVSVRGEHSSAEDTRKAALALLNASVDLLVFAGGDGTARDIYDVLKTDALEQALPVLGIPAGVKIHSGVYALSPVAAANVLADIWRGQAMSLYMAEVRDINEALLRQEKVQSKTYGEMAIPVSPRYIQQVKCGGVEKEELVLSELAHYLADTVLAESLCIMGSGSTLGAIMDSLGLPNSLLGVDAVTEGEVIAADLTEQQLWDLLNENELSDTTSSVKLLVTVIGGQGHVFGRGNQQLSPRVIQRIGLDNIIIVATKNKLDSLQQRPIIVDTGDASLDQQLCGLRPVLTAYDDYCVYRVAQDYGDS